MTVQRQREQVQHEISCELNTGEVPSVHPADIADTANSEVLEVTVREQECVKGIRFVVIL